MQKNHNLVFDLAHRFGLQNKTDGFLDLYFFLSKTLSNSKNRRQNNDGLTLIKTINFSVKFFKSQKTTIDCNLIDWAKN